MVLTCILASILQCRQPPTFEYFPHSLSRFPTILEPETLLVYATNFMAAASCSSPVSPFLFALFISDARFRLLKQSANLPGLAWLGIAACECRTENAHVNARSCDSRCSR